MKTKVLTDTGLTRYDQKIKDYIQQESEITSEDVINALGYTPNTPTEVDNKIASYDSEVATNDDIDALFA